MLAICYMHGFHYAFFVCFIFLIFTMTFEIMDIRVTDEDMEVQRGDIIFPRSHRKGGRAGH